MPAKKPYMTGRWKVTESRWPHLAIAYLVDGKAEPLMGSDVVYSLDGETLIGPDDVALGVLEKFGESSWAVHRRDVSGFTVGPVLYLDD